MKTKFKSQRKGAVLATVTVVSVMMVVILMAATQLVSHTNSKTNVEYRKKQAYYVAASCCRAFVAETTGFTTEAAYSDDVIQAKIAQLQSVVDEDPIEVKITSEGHGGDEVGVSQPRWNNAKCTLKVEQYGTINSLKVISTATYLGQTKTVVAYLNIETLRMHKFTPKALEIIGTDGGIDDKFENLQVYGATGATSMESHDLNTVYCFNHNENKLYGDTDINGSMAVQNNNRFYSNPYYCQGEDDTKGCVVNVSRSMVFVANTPTFDPDKGKDITDMTMNPNQSGSDYNYLNVRQALIFGSNNAMIGVNDNFSVDAHAGMIYFGRENTIGNALKTACARKDPTDTTVDVDAYWTKVKSGFSWGDANGNTIHGHVFTHSDDTGDNMFNGDMEIANVKVNVTGDVYLDGDLYMYGSDAQLTTNTVHLKPGHYVYNCARQYDNTTGDVVTPDPSNRVTTLNGVTSIIFNDDWSSVERGKRPEFPLLSETPYYYYPEHLLCQQGVSTIKAQYESMYTTDADGNQVIDTANVKNITDASFRNKDSNGNYNKVYGDETGTGPVFRPDYVVTESCYIDKLGEIGKDDGGAYILIDVDEAEEKDIVVILKDGGSCRNNNVILVKNSTDPEDPNEARFVYFVSDSGVGTTYNEYAATGDVSTYDHSSFKVSKFNFIGATNIVMDLESYFHSDVYTDGNRARCSGLSLNPTADTTKDGYPLHSNNIFFLITEGCELFCGDANTILQACVYMPRARYHTNNKGRSIKVDPYFTTTDMESVAIIGNLVCNHYDVSRNGVSVGNRNAIVYLPFSPCSMLSIIKGTGEEHATQSYMLDHYEAS